MIFLHIWLYQKKIGARKIQQKREKKIISNLQRVVLLVLCVYHKDVSNFTLVAGNQSSPLRKVLTVNFPASASVSLGL